MASTLKALTPVGTAIYFTKRDLEVLLYALRSEQQTQNRLEEGAEVSRMIHSGHHDTPDPIRIPSDMEIDQLVTEIAGPFRAKEWLD